MVRHVVDLRMGGQLFGGIFGYEQHVVGLALAVLAEQGAAAQVRGPRAVSTRVSAACPLGLRAPRASCCSR
jgi:hypothetical protein